MKEDHASADEKEARLRAIFDHLDHDKNGSLDFEELKRGFADAGLCIDDKQIQRMIEVADDNKNHTIEFDEFYRIGSQAHTHDLNTISEYWLQFSNKPIMKEAVSSVPAWKLLIAGGVAGAVSRTCTSPLERLKILNQVQGMHKPSSAIYTRKQGVMRSLIEMAKVEGFAGFFKGNGTNVIRIVPYSAIQFLSYENYKRFVLRRNSARGEDPNHLTPIQNLMVGGLAGITCLLFTYPLDLIRSRLTVQINENRYIGIVGTYKTVIRDEGHKGLYKGMFTSILGVAPYVAINFTTYESLKRYTISENRPPSVLESLGFGAFAGAVAQTVTYPIDLLRRRMQTQGIGGEPLLYKGPWDAAKQIVRNDGIAGLYRGMVPCYLKVIPAISISFCVYEVMRTILKIETKKVSIHT